MQLLLLLLTSSISLVIADLQTDLEAFKTLIPRRRIGFIAAQHYLGDQSFRKAWAFAHSDDFSKVYQQVRESPEIVDILEFVSEEVDINSLVDRIPNHVRSFKIPMKMPPNDALTQRNLASFLQDVMRALPRASISTLMARKVREDGDFSKLYRILRSKEFKEKLDVARHSVELHSALEELNRNSIDVDDLINTLFRLLSWGP